MDEWTKECLEELVGRPEGLYLEFKSTRLFETKDKAADTLTKGVSAFANSDGGVLVVGLEEKPGTQRHKVVARVSDGVSPALVSTTWLNQIIQDNISPMMPGLRVLPIALGDPKLPIDHSEQQLAFVIEVPRNQRAVQAKDGIFYQRQEDRSVPMRAHQIDDVNNRLSGPDIQLSLRNWMDGPTQLKSDGSNRWREANLEVVAKNHSDTVVNLALLRLVVPQSVGSRLKHEAIAWETPPISPLMVLHIDGEWRREASASVREAYFPGSGPPLFKGVSWRRVGILTVILRENYQQVPHHEPIVLLAEAPNMRPRSFEVALEVDVGGALTIKRLGEGSVMLDGIVPSDYFAQL